MTLDEYKDSLSHMKVNKKGDKIAPHKAILLLAIIDLIENGIIKDSFIPLSDELIRTFGNVWANNVSTINFTKSKFSYPFFHLQTSSFWELIQTSDYIGQNEYSSISALKRDFIGAKMDDELFHHLSYQEIRDEIRQLLHNTYLTTQPSSNSNKLGLLAIIGVLFSVA